MALFILIRSACSGIRFFPPEDIFFDHFCIVKPQKNEQDGKPRKINQADTGNS